MYRSGREPIGARRRRVGLALALVLICLAVAMMLGVAVTRTVLMHYQHAQVLAQQEQSFWLAESAMQRAVQQLRASTDYRGEQWKIPSNSLGGTADASVLIRVEPGNGPDAPWKINVQSSYPEQPPHRVVVERELSVDASALGPSTVEKIERS